MSRRNRPRRAGGGTPRTLRRRLPAALLVALLGALCAGASPGASAGATSGTSARLARLTKPVVLPGFTPEPTVPSGAVTVSPTPGSETADPRTQISFLGRPLSQLGTITVFGSLSGTHTGKLEAYSTAKGASFVPDHPFDRGEVVTVHSSLPIAGATGGTFSFTVADTVAVSGPITVSASRTTVPGVDHFASAPAVEPPAVTVLQEDQAPAGGDFLLTPKGKIGEGGPMIVSPQGQLVWFEPTPPGEESFDLDEQRYHGQDVLTWFQGRPIGGHGEGEGIIADDHYQTIATVRAGNGVEMDLHDFQLTVQGAALITAYRAMRWNLTAVGGASDGIVFDGVVQEIDIPTGLVMEEWDSLDHVPVTASYYGAHENPDNPDDYFHVNSIQQLAGGDLLVGARNTSAAYEVDPADDGAILFTLGGKQPSAAMGSGTQFWFQHDVELHAGGIFTIFDDGALPPREPYSRALVEQVSLASKQVDELHGFYRPAVLAGALGNVEELRDGDLVVGWGTDPGYSELSPDGALLYEAALPDGDDSYRAYRYPWVGRPETRPALAVGASAGVLHLAMSWNGETGISAWRVLDEPKPTAIEPVATVAATGFETTATIGARGAGTLLQVQALGPGGTVLGTSARVEQP